MTTNMLLAFTPALIAAVMQIGCGVPEISTEFYLANGYSFTASERAAIQSTADQAVREVRAILPSLPRGLVLKVSAGHDADVIPETGETGTAIPPATIQWTVDPRRPGGVSRVVTEELRASLFHELHHLTRYRAFGRSADLMDNVVLEGLATAFERDFAGATPPWGTHPPSPEAWVAELLAQPPDTQLTPWLARHPDGRRWVGLRAGTFLVDRAMTNAGGNAATLVAVSAAEILTRAGLGPR